MFSNPELRVASASAKSHTSPNGNWGVWEGRNGVGVGGIKTKAETKDDLLEKHRYFY